MFCRHIFCYIFVTSLLGQLVYSKQNFVYCISCLHCSGSSVDTWNAQGWKTPEELGTVSTLDPLDMWINFAVSGVFSAKHCACYMRLLSIIILGKINYLKQYFSICTPNTCLEGGHIENGRHIEKLICTMNIRIIKFHYFNKTIAFLIIIC